MNVWQRVIDDELVCAHLTVANETDSYEEAKRKLNMLLEWLIAVATDPAVNGGYKLMKISEELPCLTVDLEYLILAVGKILEKEKQNSVVLSRNEFNKSVMQIGRGMFNPLDIKEIVDAIFDERGIK